MNYSDIQKEAIESYESNLHKADFTDQLYKKYNVIIKLDKPKLNKQSNGLNMKLPFDFDILINNGKIESKNENIEVWNTEKDLAKIDHAFTGLPMNGDDYSNYVYAFSEDIIHISDKVKKINILSYNSDSSKPTHILIDSEKNDISVNYFITSSSDALPIASMVDINAKNGSTINFNLINLMDKSDLASIVNGRSDSYSTVNINDVILGGNVVKESTHLNAEGDKSSAKFNRTVVSYMDQKLDMFSDITNRGIGSICETSTSAVAFDNSKCDIKDIAHVNAGARQSYSHISQRGLIADKGVNLNLMPDMSINESYTKASHSSYSSPLDDNMIFYLQSKGIELNDAKKLIILGSLLSNTNSIDDNLKSYLANMVNYKLDHKDYKVPEKLKDTNWIFTEGKKSYDMKV